MRIRQNGYITVLKNPKSQERAPAARARAQCGPAMSQAWKGETRNDKDSNVLFCTLLPDSCTTSCSSTRRVPSFGLRVSERLLPKYDFMWVLGVLSKFHLHLISYHIYIFMICQCFNEKREKNEFHGDKTLLAQLSTLYES
jgi:hypothetical protein